MPTWDTSGNLPFDSAGMAWSFHRSSCNTLGQGALLARQPDALANPFYLLAPGWFLLPLVGLATLATIIASQAMLSGAFSLTNQAIQ
ncbi:MAG: KUP/HAK/KT family potassium transporter, partial [Nitrospirota bacterium]